MRQGSTAQDWKMISLDPTGQVVASMNPKDKVTLCHPSIAVYPKGRIVVSFEETGPGVKHLSGKKGKSGGKVTQTQIVTSDDDGATWHPRAEAPFGRGRMMRDGAALVLIGHTGNLQLIESRSNGETWEKPSEITGSNSSENKFNNGPANVWHEEGRLLTAFLEVTDPHCKGLKASVLSPVIAETAAGGSYSKTKDWTLSHAHKAFRDFFPHGSGAHLGIPYFDVPKADKGIDLGSGRWVNRIGWHALHVTKILDPNHLWHDPSGETYHLIGSTYSHRGNVATVIQAKREGTRFQFSIPQSPSGSELGFIALPGGHAGFDFMYDAPSKRYWVVSNPADDSMRKVSELKEAGLPCDPAPRLALYHSKNLVDWELAGVVAQGHRETSPAFAVKKDDLYIVTRSGVKDLKQPHRSLEVRLRKVPKFRELLG